MKSLLATGVFLSLRPAQISRKLKNSLLFSLLAANAARRPVSLDCMRHHAVLGNSRPRAHKHEGRFRGHFAISSSGFSVSADGRVFATLSARLSLAAKIPFPAANGRKMS
jgi:hypothetical protein